MTCAPWQPTRVKKDDRKALRCGPAPSRDHRARIRKARSTGRRGRAAPVSEQPDLRPQHVLALGGDHRQAADEARKQQRHRLDRDQLAVEQLVAWSARRRSRGPAPRRSRTAPRTAPCPTARTARSRRGRRCSSIAGPRWPRPVSSEPPWVRPTAGASAHGRHVDWLRLWRCSMRMRRRSRAFARTSSTGMMCSCSSRQAYQTKIGEGADQAEDRQPPDVPDDREAADRGEEGARSRRSACSAAFRSAGNRARRSAGPA